MKLYKTRPSFLKGIKKYLTTEYGIKNNEVYINNSVFGAKFGSRPSLRLEYLTGVDPTGLIIGDVAFREGSHSPVVWKNVLFPGQRQA